MKAKQITIITRHLFMSVLSLLAIGITVSCEEEHIDLSTSMGQNTKFDLFRNYGRFIVINTSSKDSVAIKDGGYTQQLKARSGDSITIVFEAKEDYKNKDFTSKYTMYDRTTVEDKLSHQFKVEKVETGKEYEVQLWIKPKNVDAAVKGTSKLILQIID